MFEEGFLPKEAKFGLPKAITHGTVKSMKDLKQKISPNAEFFSPEQIAEKAREGVLNDGNGLFGDLAIGATKFIPKKGKEINATIKDKAVTMKDKVQNADQKYSQKVKDALNVTEGSMLDRFTSVKDTRELGQDILPGRVKRSIQGTVNRSSFLAPAQNTAKAVSPLLAAAYVGDKMYPGEEEQLANSLLDYQDKNGSSESDLLVAMLDKKAALDKVAFLEDEVEKLASHVEELKNEKNLFWKQAEAERLEKQEVLSDKTKLESDLIQKQAEYEEYTLRTNIRERSKNAVKVAEDLLERGIIKQAEFNKKVDFLMDCDDESFNLHTSLSKQANSSEKGLETSAYFVDYSSKEDESLPRMRKRGLSSKGQTMSEAAKDLQK